MIDHLLQIRVLQIRVLQIRVLQIRLLQIRVLQIRVLQILVLQIRVLQIHVLQIRVLQIRVLQIQSVFYISNPVHVLQYASPNTLPPRSFTLNWVDTRVRRYALETPSFSGYAVFLPSEAPNKKSEGHWCISRS